MKYFYFVKLFFLTIYEKMKTLRQIIKEELLVRQLGLLVVIVVTELYYSSLACTHGMIRQQLFVDGHEVIKWVVRVVRRVITRELISYKKGRQKVVTKSHQGHQTVVTRSCRGRQMVMKVIT
jgi:hypothetical protein